MLINVYDLDKFRGMLMFLKAAQWPAFANAIPARRGGSPRSAAKGAGLGGILSALTGLAAMAHLFAALWHIPGAADHHAHGFALRKENRSVQP